jgi:hypothetical protein
MRSVILMAETEGCCLLRCDLRLFNRCSTLKTEAACPCNMLVPIYKLHGAISQKTVSFRIDMHIAYDIVDTYEV